MSLVRLDTSVNPTGTKPPTESDKAQSLATFRISPISPKQLLWLKLLNLLWWLAWSQESVQIISNYNSCFLVIDYYVLLGGKQVNVTKSGRPFITVSLSSVWCMIISSGKKGLKMQLQVWSSSRFTTSSKVGVMTRPTLHPLSSQVPCKVSVGCDYEEFVSLVVCLFSRNKSHWCRSANPNVPWHRPTANDKMA